MTSGVAHDVERNDHGYSSASGAIADEAANSVIGKRVATTGHNGSFPEPRAYLLWAYLPVRSADARSPVARGLDLCHFRVCALHGVTLDGASRPRIAVPRHDN